MYASDYDIAISVKYKHYSCSTLYTSCHPIYESNKIFPEPCFTKSSLINIASMYSIICQHNHEILGTNINHYISARLPNK